MDDVQVSDLVVAPGQPHIVWEVVGREVEWSRRAGDLRPFVRLVPRYWSTQVEPAAEITLNALTLRKVNEMEIIAISSQ